MSRPKHESLADQLRKVSEKLSKHEERNTAHPEPKKEHEGGGVS